MRLPARPPPGLPAALRAGLLTTTEALLRGTVLAFTSCIGHPSTWNSAATCARLADNLEGISGTSLLLLLAHGDPAQGAALLTTIAKTVLRQAEVAVDAGATAGVVPVSKAAVRIMYDLESGVRSSSGGGREPAAGAAAGQEQEGRGQVGKGAAGTFDTAVGSGAVAGDSSSSSSSSSSSPAEQQLLRLWCFALPRWLPVLARLRTILDGSWKGKPGEAYDVPRMSTAITGCVAEVLCQAVGACRDAWRRGDVRAVGSWRQLLQRELCVRDWVCKDESDVWEAEEWWAERVPVQRQTREQQHGRLGKAAQAAGSGGGAGGSATPGSSSSSSRGSSAPASTSCRFVLPLAPHEAASLLPTCSNPLCTTLHWNSEAQVDLPVAPGPGSGPGTAAGRLFGPAAAELPHTYCCAACCTTHRKLQLRNAVLGQL